MKKTLTVNLGGTVYHIDDDAYNLLDNYLNNLRYHFRKEEGADEIVRDMETRIAELFDEYIRTGLQVITVEQVEAVIARMGNPEDLNTDDDEEKKETEQHAYSNGPARRLFRNPDDRVLGGVLSGLSAYFGWDVTLIRIGALVLGCFVHGLILAYLIAWIIIPLAKTATEKLQMRGEPINMENIGRTVTEGFDKVNDYVHSEKPRSFLRQLGNAIVKIAGFIIKFILVLLAICLTPVLLAGLVVLFALLMAATGMLASVPAVLYYSMPDVDWSLIGSSSSAVIGLSVCGLFVVGIPIIGLLQLILQSFNVWKPMSTTTKVILTLVWFISLVVGFIFLFNTSFIQGPIWWL
ncbi:pspC domain protein [Bacteroides sp. CAG:1076]|jgi:phage shock protein PspC (stress-responsive transcriptional regulator)|uniref:PspC domain-containing protein n=1 Tax=Phocaeicola sp. TaxID=2773926 RepID=UPI00033C97AF|nr:pspC domain protein [Bacteroides sp. CAG:1076]